MIWTLFVGTRFNKRAIIVFDNFHIYHTNWTAMPSHFSPFTLDRVD